MSEYVKIEFDFLTPDQKEMAIALLTEMNYEGFEEEGDLLKAYIPEAHYDEKELDRFAIRHQINFSVSKLENKNWNQEWESNFHPAIINDAAHNDPWVGIRADFHEPIRNVQHEIIITPKMSFGTGHHATTSMMIKMMSELEFKGKTVLDFGTGTGILAILSEKLGALKIEAIDNDDQSIINAKENFKANNCSRIRLIKASGGIERHPFDIILTNIVKVVIMNNLNSLLKHLVPGGIMVLSGLLRDDENELLQLLMKRDLFLKKRIEEDDWICLQMVYSDVAMFVK